MSVRHVPAEVAPGTGGAGGAPDIKVETQVVPRDIELPLTRRQLRDRMRGYSINYTYVAIAYAGEIILIVASLVGAWLFAQMYGHGVSTTMTMMMLAPISYAVVEMCRVPLAMACRTQKNFLIKSVLALGVVFAAGVTVKSLSQLGEQMFHPRLIDVVNATEALKLAEREQSTFDKKLRDADELVERRGKELNAVDQRAMGFVAEMSRIEAPKCLPVSGTDRNGRIYRSVRCSASDLRGPIIEANLKTTTEERDAARKLLDEATAQRSTLKRDIVDLRVSDAKKAHREAVLNSQLHSFTAMVYGKEPTEVGDGEVHTFLRYFVFFPAIFASLASTLLALGAVNRIKPVNREPPSPCRSRPAATCLAASPSISSARPWIPCTNRRRPKSPRPRRG